MRVIFGTLFICSTLLAVHSREDLDGEATALVQTTKVLDLATEANGGNIVMELTSNGDVHQIKNEEFNKFDEGIFDVEAWKKTLISSKKKIDIFCGLFLNKGAGFGWKVLDVAKDALKIDDTVGGNLDILKAGAATLNISLPPNLVLPDFISDIKMKKVKKLAKSLCACKQKVDTEMAAGKRKWKREEARILRRPCLVTVVHEPAVEAVEAASSGGGWFGNKAIKAVKAVEEKNSTLACKGGENYMYKGKDACNYDLQNFEQIEMSWGCFRAVVVSDDGCLDDGSKNFVVKDGEVRKDFTGMQFLGKDGGFIIPFSVTACRLVVVPTKKTVKRKWTKKRINRKLAATKKRIKKKWAACKKRLSRR